MLTPGGDSARGRRARTACNVSGYSRTGTRERAETPYIDIYGPATHIHLHVHTSHNHTEHYALLLHATTGCVSEDPAGGGRGKINIRTQAIYLDRTRNHTPSLARGSKDTLASAPSMARKHTSARMEPQHAT